MDELYDQPQTQQAPGAPLTPSVGRPLVGTGQVGQIRSTGKAMLLYVVTAGI